MPTGDASGAELLRALFLGALQGATEFLPVSSSGHLVILPELLGWPQQSLSFNVVVHLATALAVLIYFRADWWAMCLSGLRGLREGRPWAEPEARLLWLLALGSLPAVAAGLLLQDPLAHALEETSRQAAQVAALMLFATGGLLLLSERLGTHDRGTAELGPLSSLGIGVAQAFAILPGISRSGATIAAGLLIGLDRESAARFSFLLGTPIMIGAGLMELADVALAPPERVELLALAAGGVTAFVVGYAAIGWLLAYVRRASLTGFVLYVWAFGAIASWLLW